MEIKDLRPKLSVVANPPELRRRGIISRRSRRGSIQGVVIHYNGPALPFAGNPQKELDFVVRVDVPNHQKRIGGDSLMYHYVVLSDGSVYQTRDDDLIAWHAANTVANERHLGIHLPLGGTQDATERQWAAVLELVEHLGGKYGFSRDAVTGHREWSKTTCPGPHLMRRIKEYRGSQEATKPEPYSLWECTKTCNLRQAPRTTIDGQPVPVVREVVVGERVLADLVKTTGDAEAIHGDRRWIHFADGSGFVWAGNFRRLPL